MYFTFSRAHIRLYTNSLALGVGKIRPEPSATCNCSQKSAERELQTIWKLYILQNTPRLIQLQMKSFSLVSLKYARNFHKALESRLSGKHWSVSLKSSIFQSATYSIRVNDNMSTADDNCRSTTELHSIEDVEVALTDLWRRRHDLFTGWIPDDNVRIRSSSHTTLQSTRGHFQ